LRAVAPSEEQRISIFGEDVWVMGRLEPEKLVLLLRNLLGRSSNKQIEKGSVKMRHFQRKVDGVIDGDANQAAPPMLL